MPAALRLPPLLFAIVWNWLRCALTLATSMSGASVPEEPPPTVRVYCAVWSAWPSPRTVRVYVPGAAEAVVDTVMVALLPEVTDEGLKETETPAGAPVADSATDWPLPLVTVVETVAVVELPGWTLPEEGPTAME